MTRSTAARLKKIARWIAVAVLSLWAIYIIGANIFLSSSLFEKVINAEPEVVWIRYERGYSIIPGKIHAKKLYLQASDSNVQWILTLDDVDFDVDLIGLTHKHFTVTKANGQGISFRARQKKPAPLLTEEVAAHLPPMPGYGRLPIRPPEPPGPERWNDDAWKLWTISLSNITARDIREVWIDGARMQGSFGASGGFYLKPIRKVEIGWIDLRVDRGTMTLDGKPALASIGGTARLRIDPFDPRAIDDEKLLRLMSTRSDFRFIVPDVGALAMIPVNGELRAKHLAVNIDHGVLADGSHMHFIAPHATAKLHDQDVAGSGALEARVEARELRLHSHFDDVKIGPALHVGHLITDGEARELDLTRQLSDLHLTSKLEEAALGDARALNALLPPDEALSFHHGTANAHGVIETWPAQHRARGYGELYTPDLGVRLGKSEVMGQMHVAGSFGSLLLDQRRMDDAKLEITVVKGSVEAQRGKLVDFGLIRSAAEAKSIDLDDPLKELKAKIAVKDGVVFAQNLLESYVPKGNKMRVDRAHARFDADAELELADHRARGHLHTTGPRMGFAYGALGIVCDLEANARVHDWAWEKGDLVVDEASVVARRIEVTKRDAGEKAVFSIERIAVTGKSRHFAFSDPLASAEVRGRVEGGHVRDAAALSSFLPEGASFSLVTKDGSFDATFDAAVVKHVARGHVKAHAKSLGVASTKLRVQGDLAIEAAIEQWDLERNTLAFEDAKLVVDDLEGAFAKDKEAPDFRAKKIAFDGRASSFDLAHPSLSNVDFHLVVDNAELGDARALQGLLPKQSITIQSGSALANADVRVSSSEKTASGTIHLDLDAALRLKQTDVKGTFAFGAKVAGWDPDTDRLDLSGTSIAARRVTVEGSETASWKADVLLDRASIHLGKEPMFFAHAVLDADDAEPIFSLVASSLPKPLTSLLRAPSLHATAALRLSSHVYAIEKVHAVGGDVLLKGSFIAHGEKQHGAFVIEKGPVSAGIRLDEDGASPRFFNLGSWLAREERSAVKLLEHTPEEQEELAKTQQLEQKKLQKEQQEEAEKEAEKKAKKKAPSR